MTLYDQALSCIEKQQHDEALRLLDTWIADSHRHDADALYARGVTRMALGSYRDATCDLLKSVALNRTAPRGYRQLGYLQFMLGKEDAALATLRAGIALDPDDPSLYCVIGDIHLDRAEFDDAHAAFTQAMERDPDSAEAHGRMAIYHIARGNMAALRSQHAELQRLDPELADRIAALCFDSGCDTDPEAADTETGNTSES